MRPAFWCSGTSTYFQSPAGIWWTSSVRSLAAAEASSTIDAARTATIKAMNHSMAQRRQGLSPLELPGWKTALNWIAAFLLAILFLISGVWKITDVSGAAMRLVEARVPESLSLFAALAFGIAETVAGALILVPRFRRWGAILATLLLAAFLLYFALNYSALRGADCSCFPWVKRVVG